MLKYDVGKLSAYSAMRRGKFPATDNNRPASLIAFNHDVRNYELCRSILLIFVCFAQNLISNLLYATTANILLLAGKQ